MSMSVNPYSNTTLMNQFWNNVAQRFWSNSGTGGSTSGVFDYLSEQCDTKVTLALDKVGDRVVTDLAGEVADYLSDKPELSEEYVIVIVEDPVSGRQARAYRRDDLVAELESPEKEEVLEKLKDNNILGHNSLGDLPDMPRGRGTQRPDGHRAGIPGPERETIEYAV